MEGDDRIEDAGAEVFDGGNAADNPGVKLVVGDLHQRLEIGEIVIIEARYMGIREGSEKQVHLAHSAMPSAKQRTAAARVEALAGAGGSGHRARLARCAALVNPSRA
jgi:hypothetical protein